VVSEYLLSDYSRKGYIDGRSLRLPTIVVRPGKANAAASSFASAVLREPLNGVTYECPLPPETGVWLLSPRRVVEAFITRTTFPRRRGARTVAEPARDHGDGREMIAAMGKIAGAQAAKRVSWKTDPRIEKIVKAGRCASPRPVRSEWGSRRTPASRP